MLAAALPGAGAVAVLAGCGSGGGTGGASEREFTRKANQVCSDANAANRRLAERIQDAQRGADADRVFAQLADLTRESARTAQPFLDRLDALDTPPGDREEIKGWIASLRRQQTLLRELAGAFERQDQRRITALSEQVDDLGTQANAFAARYGMSECARAE